MGVIRFYTDSKCVSWETYANGEEVFILLEEFRNKWEQDICKVLFHRGIRWLYRMDVEVVNETR